MRAQFKQPQRELQTENDILRFEIDQLKRQLRLREAERDFSVNTEYMMVMHMACLTAIVDVCGTIDVKAQNTEEWAEAGAVLRSWALGDATDEQATQYFKAHTGLYKE